MGVTKMNLVIVTGDRAGRSLFKHGMSISQSCSIEGSYTVPDTSQTQNIPVYDYPYAAFNRQWQLNSVGFAQNARAILFFLGPDYPANLLPANINGTPVIAIPQNSPRSSVLTTLSACPPRAVPQPQLLQTAVHRIVLDPEGEQRRAHQELEARNFAARHELFEQRAANAQTMHEMYMRQSGEAMQAFQSRLRFLQAEGVARQSLQDDWSEGLNDLWRSWVGNMQE